MEPSRNYHKLSGHIKKSRRPFALCSFALELLDLRDRRFPSILDAMDGEEVSRAVMRLASERPEWIPVLRAATERARKSEPFGGEFAGHWVLRELDEQTGSRNWLPGLRLLVGYGLIEKSGESTRGGRRAYYRMPNRTAVEGGLRELDSLDRSH